MQLLDIRGAAVLQEMVSDLTILRSRLGKVFEPKPSQSAHRRLAAPRQSASTWEVLLRWELASLGIGSLGGEKGEPGGLRGFMRGNFQSFLVIWA
ncbi:hypothetical protein F4779DRAFT_585689 [Xylariaceae sp. FL0662B]|nr:hypothetical protein F4779DRAFT_585689 [Xylariaceae sp. FL0662B]